MPLELAAEKEAIGALVKEWKGSKEGAEDDDDIDIYMRERKDEAEELREAMEAGKESTVFARVKVPTQVQSQTRICASKIIFQLQADIEEALLRRKKQELLEMYAIGRFESLIVCHW